MARFDRQIATALRLIEKNGQSVTWRSIIDGTPVDAAKPWNPGAATNTDNTVEICFLPVRKEDLETLSFVKGSEVGKGYVKGLMGQVSFAPSLKDVVIRDSKHLRIAHIDILAPNGQVVLYKILLEQ